MFELFGLFVAFLVLAGVVVGLVMVAGLFKLLFHAALLPVTLAFAAIKFVLGAVAVLFLLTVGLPVLILGFLLCLPLLLFGALIWGAGCLVAVV